MRVPVIRTPQTNPATRQQGFAQGQAADLSGLAQGLKQFSGAMDRVAYEAGQEQRRRQQFDLSKRLLEEKNFADEDFQQRLTDPSRNIDSFAEDVDLDLEERHAALFKEYEEKGYDRDLVEDFYLKLGGVRDSKFGQGLAYQGQALAARAGEDVEKLTLSGSQVIERDIGTFEETLEGTYRMIDLNPDLTVPERIARKQRARDVYVGTGSKAWSAQDPNGLLQTLDPTGLYQQQNQPGYSSAIGQAAEGFDMSRYLTRNRSAESGGNDNAKPETSSAYGRYQFLKGTWVENYKAVFGETGETEKQILRKRADGAIQDKVMQHFTGQNVALLQGADLPVDDGTVYLTHFLGRGDGPKVLAASPDTPVENVVSPASIRANREVFKGIKTAGQLVAWARDKMGVSAPVGYALVNAGYNPTEQQWTVYSKPSAIESFDPGPSTAVQAPPLASYVPEGDETMQAEAALMGETGNPLADAMSGPERLQAIGWALEEVKSRRVELNAVFDVRRQNAEAESLATGSYSGLQLSKEDFITRHGPVEGLVEWEKFQSKGRIGTFARSVVTSNPAAISAAVEALRPTTDSTDPGYGVKLQVYNDAREAAQRVMDARKADPAAYVFGAFPEIRQALASAQGVDAGRVVYQQFNEAYNRLGIPQYQRTVLPKEDLEKALANYTLRSPEQKIEYWDNMRGMMGSLYKPFLAQMAKAGLTVDATMSYIMSDSPGYRQTAAQVIRGMHEMKADPNRRPSKEVRDLLTTISPSHFVAFRQMNPVFSKAYQDAAIALYVAEGGDAKDPNVTLLNESLEQVVGGQLIYAGKGKAQTNTLLPPGISATRFDDWVDRLTPNKLVGLSLNGTGPVYRSGDPITVQDVQDDGVFVMEQPGLYKLQMSGNGGFAKDIHGRTYLLQITADAVRGQ